MTYNLKVGSRQNLKNRMDVRREFYLQKKNVLATTFECTMHQFHDDLNSKFRVGRKQRIRWFMVALVNVPVEAFAGGG